MYDKELIQRICDLTCSKNDVARVQTSIEYDTDNPFKKYYSLSAIKGAIEKYLSKEWDDKTLAHWACIYCWIIAGGSGNEKTEDLNSLEGFLRDVICWDLDGLSFFSAEIDNDLNFQKTIQLYEDYDHILQTHNEWRAVYAMIGPNAEHNGDQYVLLINEKAKEYMIIYSDHLENGYEDENFKFVNQNEHIALVEQLKMDGYTIMSCSEESYYMEINDL